MNVLDYHVRKMKVSTKAILLSVFVYPGAGHLYLKKYVAGVAIATIASVAFYILLSSAISNALIISEKIINGEAQADITAIREMIEQQQTASETHLIVMMTWLLIAIWVIGMVDVYRIRRRLEPK